MAAASNPLTLTGNLLVVITALLLAGSVRSG
jgi:hypothetical protein